jgi:hypothetical protein
MLQLRRLAALVAATTVLGCCGCKHDHACTYVDDDIAYLNGTNQPLEPKSRYVRWATSKPKPKPETKSEPKHAEAPETEKTTPASTK